MKRKINIQIDLMQSYKDEHKINIENGLNAVLQSIKMNRKFKINIQMA